MYFGTKYGLKSKLKSLCIIIDNRVGIVFKTKNLLYIKEILVFLNFREKDMTKTYQENCYIMETSILNN